MKNSWTVAQLANAVSGKVFPTDFSKNLNFQQVVTDSRVAVKNSLYIAIVGKRLDGHDFCQQAVDNGAKVLLVETKQDIKNPSIVQVLVDDSSLALGKFAAWHRQQLDIECLIGITGSNGKTTTKHILQEILQNLAPTYATRGNLNNKFGVPRTLLEMNKQHKFAVVEMGANHAQEISYLTQLVKPDIALITNVSEAHLEGFGSLQAVVEAKAEIFEGLSKKGIVIYPVPSIGVNYWQEKSCNFKRFTFGDTEQVDVQLLKFKQYDDYISFSICFKGYGKSKRIINLQAPLLGRHNAMNVCAAFAALLAINLDMDKVAKLLQKTLPVAGRLNLIKLKNKVIIIDDSYNANAASVKAAIDTLCTLRKASEYKTIFCMGALAELADRTDATHKELAIYAKKKAVDYLLVYGKQAKSAVDVFGVNAELFSTHEALNKKLNTLLATESISHILIKGSRSSNMDLITKMQCDQKAASKKEK